MYTYLGCLTGKRVYCLYFEKLHRDSNTPDIKALKKQISFSLQISKVIICTKSKINLIDKLHSGVRNAKLFPPSKN